MFRGRIDIPVIDWRHYLEDAPNMHNGRQSVVSRLRIIEAKGNADNQVIWFTDARPNGPQTDAIRQAFQVMDRCLNSAADDLAHSDDDARPDVRVRQQAVRAPFMVGLRQIHRVIQDWPAPFAALNSRS